MVVGWMIFVLAIVAFIIGWQSLRVYRRRKEAQLGQQFDKKDFMFN